MNRDEQAIREMVDTWMAATKAGDLETVLGLIAEDAVFTVAGREPFGKEEFADGSRAMKGAAFDGTSEVVEMKVLGDWAWLRNRLRVSMAMPGGEPMVRAGYTLTILRRNSAGRWQIARDANLLSPVARS